jgi:L-ascorbate metabolism protein UlaG (beta-lactamase superfamily)
MKKIFFYLTAFIVFSAFICPQCISQNNLQITYIANEGFLISGGNKKILIDALFKSKNYTCPSDSLVSKILNNSAPADNINYLLVTHAHPDHFSEKLTTEFLLKNPKVRFISTRESCSKLIEAGYNGTQIIPCNPEFGEIKEINEITDSIFSVTAFRLNHGGSPDIDNLAYIIRINDFAIMHMGDAFVLHNEEYIKKINWDNYKIDVLFVGYMDINQFVLDILDKTIKPKTIIMMHIHEDDIQEAKERNEQYSGRAVLFEKELDIKSFSK